MELEQHRHKICEGCGKLAQYSPDYDSYLCLKCNEFLDKKCDDPKCYYCPKRPDRPIQKDD